MRLRTFSRVLVTALARGRICTLSNSFCIILEPRERLRVSLRKIETEREKTRERESERDRESQREIERVRER